MPRGPADMGAGTPGIAAAGAVAWRTGPDSGEQEVLLVHRTKYDDWSLPKGKQDPGEPLPVTAVREVFEESGARVTLGRRLRPVSYPVRGRPKLVTYWSGRTAGTDAGAVPNSEVDQIAWLPVARARERVTYPHDATVLDDFAAAPADTVPLILLRHAQAVPRAGWKGDDTGRPLDDKGLADAKALAGLLSCFAPRATVTSSAAVRCLATVLPYRQLTGSPVQATAALQISRTGPGDPSAVIARAVAAGTPAVLCAHRENLGDLLSAAAAQGPPGSLACCAGETLPTAAFCVLHMAAGELAGADRYDLSEVLAFSPLSCAAARRRRSRRVIQMARPTTTAMST